MERFDKYFLLAITILFLIGFGINYYLSAQGEIPNTFFKISLYGEVKIENGFLYINNKPQCSKFQTETAEEKVIVDYVLKPFKNTDVDILNIGLGCGFTTEAIMKRTGRVDVVEINPDIIEASKYFTDVAYYPRVNIIIDDGLHYLKTTDKKYHSIILDIENPAVAHSSNLFTSEAFAIIKNSLKQGGTFGLWVYPCSKKYYAIVYNTLKENFDYVYHLNDNVFISSNIPLDFEEKEFMETEINNLNKNVLGNEFRKYCWEDEWIRTN